MLNRREPIYHKRDWYLKAEYLKITRIVELARHSEESRLFDQFTFEKTPTDDIWGPRFSNIVNAVRSGELKTISHESGKPDLAATCAADLCAYVEGRRGDWEWAVSFCLEWTSVLGLKQRSKRGRRKGSGGLQSKDRPFVDRAKQMIADGRASSVHQAVRAVVPDMKHGQSEDANIRRLMSRLSR
jgi:hypothetical protein